MPPEGPQKGGPAGSAGAREVIFEYLPIGASVKVSAIDVETGLEVSVVGPAIASRAELERLAANKLRYMLARRRDEGKSEPDPEDNAGGGIIV